MLSANALHARPLATAVDVVQAYVANNRMPASDVPDLLKRVHAALQQLAGRSTPAARIERTVRPDAAVVRVSVRPDGLVSFINGRTYQTLKRHLTANGLDPRQYRERFGLPSDYPMVAPTYAHRRSEIAMGIRPGAKPAAAGDRQSDADSGRGMRIAPSTRGT